MFQSEMLVDSLDRLVPINSFESFQAGTIAGNLSIKHANVEFPSDMFIILEAAGAKMTISSGLNTTTVVSVADYVELDMNKKIILNVVLPKLDPNVYVYRSYKVNDFPHLLHFIINDWSI